ncbi:MAG: O-antigen ligase family protein [Calditerrivibrio sp.]|nr:O-antigen ligase family protein [Calditerrivibrio sp.]
MFLKLYFAYVGIMTTSRASFLGVLLAILLIIYINYKKNNRLWKYNVSFLTCYIFMFIVYQFLSDHDVVFKTIQDSMNQLSSIDSRLNIWLAQLFMFLEKPILGWGFENFKYFNYPYQLKAIEITGFSYENLGNFTYGHNEFLQILVEGGLLFFFLILYAFYKGLTNLKGVKNYKLPFLALIILYLVQFFFEWEFRYPLIGVLFAVFLSKLFDPQKYMVKQNNECNRGCKTFIICVKSVMFIVTTVLFVFLSYEYPILIEFYKKDNYEAVFKLNESIFGYKSKEVYLMKKQKDIIKKIFGDKLYLTKSTANEDIYNKLISFDSGESERLIKLTTEQLSKKEIWYYYTMLGFWYTLGRKYDIAETYYKKSIRYYPMSDAAFFLFAINSRLKFSKSYVEFYNLLPDEDKINELMKRLDEVMSKKIKSP